MIIQKIVHYLSLLCLLNSPPTKDNRFYLFKIYLIVFYTLKSLYFLKSNLVYLLTLF